MANKKREGGDQTEPRTRIETKCEVKQRGDVGGTAKIRGGTQQVHGG